MRHIIHDLDEDSVQTIVELPRSDGGSDSAADYGKRDSLR